VRYVQLGSEGGWDVPAAVGLIAADPLAALDSRLARTRAMMVVLLVVVGGALAFALARVMTRPVVQLTETAAAIAGGDLDRSFHVARRDEIGTLARALEGMRRALRTQLLVIRQQAEALRQAARRIAGAQDAERRRIAQDLHDGIQQQLVVLRMQVGWCADSSNRTRPDRRGHRRAREHDRPAARRPASDGTGAVPVDPARPWPRRGPVQLAGRSRSRSTCACGPIRCRGSARRSRPTRTSSPQRRSRTCSGTHEPSGSGRGPPRGRCARAADRGRRDRLRPGHLRARRRARPHARPGERARRLAPAAVAAGGGDDRARRLPAA
jgi:HAMP domain-containing protein